MAGNGGGGGGGGGGAEARDMATEQVIFLYEKVCGIYDLKAIVI